MPFRLETLPTEVLYQLPKKLTKLGSELNQAREASQFYPACNTRLKEQLLMHCL